MVGHVCVIAHGLSVGGVGKENNTWSIDSLMTSKLINNLIIVLKFSSFLRANNNLGLPDNLQELPKLSSSSLSLPTFPSLPPGVTFTPHLLLCVNDNQSMTMKIFTMFVFRLCI
jgi:hypothetical protein